MRIAARESTLDIIALADGERTVGRDSATVRDVGCQEFNREDQPHRAAPVVAAPELPFGEAVETALRERNPARLLGGGALEPAA